MAPQNPRDMRDYLRTLERQGTQLRAMPALIENTVKVIRVETEADRLRHPAAPVELKAQTGLYMDMSLRRRFARLILDFPAVTFNTDGTKASVHQYELWGQDQTPTPVDPDAEPTFGEEPPWHMQVTSTVPLLQCDGFIPGSVWSFRARAVGAESVQPGEWSEEILVEMLEDNTAPPQPSAPKLLSSRGQLTVTWDGRSVLGEMPGDLSHVVLAHGTSSSPVAEVAEFGRTGGFTVLGGLEYNVPQFFRVRAYDVSGNPGPWSEQVVGYVTPLVDKDLILSTIDGAKTQLRNIDAGVSILPNTIITEHLVVTEEMTAAIANFLHIKTDMLDANSIWADNAWLGYAEASLVKSDMFIGKEFEGGTFTGSTFRTGISGSRTEITKDGIRQVDALGRDLLRIGYGIETGMSLRNPGTGALTPLSGMVFGGVLWASPATVSNRIEWDIEASKVPGTTVVQAANYTATSSSVMMLCSTAAWSRSQDPTDTANFAVPPTANLQIALTPRRTGVAKPVPKGPSVLEMSLQVVPNFMPDPDVAIKDTWTIWFDNLIPGEVYDMSVFIDLTQRAMDNAIYNDGSGRAVSVVPEHYLGWQSVHVRPSAYILPR